MANGDGADEPIKIVVTPPPPPRVARVLSFALGIAAAAAGFAGYCELAGGLALASVGFNLADYFMKRGTVYIPQSAIDADGKIKALARRPGSPSSGT
jgi:hypothetical protein